MITPPVPAVATANQSTALASNTGTAVAVRKIKEQSEMALKEADIYATNAPE